jgi:DNA-binding transcriptional LysR family regulator
MNLPIDNLRTFIAVADTKGFTKAGIQVNRSQSAVSMQIKRLEEEIDKPLFERIGKTVKLTTEGNLLINYARRIVADHDNAVMALSKPALKGSRTLYCRYTPKIVGEVLIILSRCLS